MLKIRVKLENLFPWVPPILTGGVGVSLVAFVMADVVPRDTLQGAFLLTGMALTFGLLAWTTAMDLIGKLTRKCGSVSDSLELRCSFLTGHARLLTHLLEDTEAEHTRLVIASLALADGVRQVMGRAPDNRGEYLVHLGELEKELRDALPPEVVEATL